MGMKPIISPVDKKDLVAELTDDCFVRDTNFGSNKIYSITHKNAPNVLREIGRLREITFRAAGGGTGNELDLDEFDFGENPYHQIIVWNPESQSILGGYRYIKCADARDNNGNYNLATTELFNFSDRFKNDYLPFAIELGRSFVIPDYQSSGSQRRSLFTLDNLWDGIGAVAFSDPNIKYLFGKVTMYLNYNKLARDYVLTFFDKHFGDRTNLLTPIEPLPMHHDVDELRAVFTGENYKENYKILSKHVRGLGENIPPLINSYMNVSPTMQTFGTALNGGFGGVEETGILITIDDIYPNKRLRHNPNYQR